MATDKSYNGWTNYETWAVKLWMDNEQGSYNYWNEFARNTWAETADKSPNPYMNHRENARMVMADGLKAGHDDTNDHPVFGAAQGSVYADLLSAALSEVNWNEIADCLLTDIIMENLAADDAADEPVDA